MRQYALLMLLLAAVAILGVGGALALSMNVQLGGLQYQQEWVRALLQVGLIAVFGAVTAGVLEYFKDALQQQRDDSKLRFDVLRELTRAYMDVKLVRRKLQVRDELFPAQIDRLNEIQTLVELHIQNSLGLFKRTGGELRGHLQAMEHYLNKVANEPSSGERRGFNAKGFKVFANRYKRAAVLVRSEIASRSVDRVRENDDR